MGLRAAGSVMDWFLSELQYTRDMTKGVFSDQYFRQQPIVLIYIYFWKQGVHDGKILLWTSKYFLK